MRGSASLARPPKKGAGLYHKAGRGPTAGPWNDTVVRARHGAYHELGAGPGRPRNWIEQFGDPRREDVDVVDWVEMIPFAETRTYVMRVAESVVIYRAKLKGAVGPVDLTGELKG